VISTPVLSPQGQQVLIDREGLELTAYYDSVGVLTIGCGHTSAAGPPQVTEGMRISEREAWAIFARDTDTFEAVVNDAITRPMLQHHFDAFTSICYNLGETQFRGATFVDRYNAGDFDGCLEAVLWWDSPPEIIPRRQGEYCQLRDGLPYLARIDPIPPPD
jgi:lysozyme